MEYSESLPIFLKMYSPHVEQAILCNDNRYIIPMWYEFVDCLLGIYGIDCETTNSWLPPSLEDLKNLLDEGV